MISKLAVWIFYAEGLRTIEEDRQNLLCGGAGEGDISIEKSPTAQFYAAKSGECDGATKIPRPRAYVGGGSEENPLWKRSRGKATARNPTQPFLYVGQE